MGEEQGILGAVYTVSEGGDRLPREPCISRQALRVRGVEAEGTARSPSRLSKALLAPSHPRPPPCPRSRRLLRHLSRLAARGSPPLSRRGGGACGAPLAPPSPAPRGPPGRRQPLVVSPSDTPRYNTRRAGARAAGMRRRAGKLPESIRGAHEKSRIGGSARAETRAGTWKHSKASWGFPVKRSCIPLLYSTWDCRSVEKTRVPMEAAAAPGAPRACSSRRAWAMDRELWRARERYLVGRGRRFCLAREGTGGQGWVPP